MRKRLIFAALLAGQSAYVAGCVSPYWASEMNAVPVGISKQDFFKHFSRDHYYNPVARASKMTADGILEVFTMPLRQSAMANDVDYWFLFKNDRLMQWGRPEDWQQVAATYQIEFNPRASVKTP